ncbi:MAG: ABC transporter permease [Rhabdochlamydiaceae bacterium]|nr:ABC transporter permease [Rhabdochlamydiaceae bacterium]
MKRTGSYRRLTALIIKEIYQIIRDPSTIMISVILPLLLLFLYGYGVSLDLDHLKIGLVMEDTAPDAQSLAKSFTDSRYFDVKITRDRRELLPDIERGKIRGFVVIPSYFSDFRNRPDKIAPIQAIADGSETNTANFFQYYVQGTFGNWLTQEAISSNLQGLPRIEIQPRVWYNEQLQSRYFLLSGALAIIMTLIGTLLTALVVSREWERGTMEAMIATPVTPMELIAGKVIPYFVLGMLSMAICVFVTVFIFGLPFEGSLFVLSLITSAFLCSALGLGLYISTVSKSQTLSYQLAVVTGFLPAFILSGFLFEIFSMPSWIQFLTHFIPARYFVQCLQTLFLVGNVWPLILWNVLFMLLIGLLFFALTRHKTIKRLE